MSSEGDHRSFLSPSWFWRVLAGFFIATCFINEVFMTCILCWPPISSCDLECLNHLGMQPSRFQPHFTQPLFKMELLWFKHLWQKVPPSFRQAYGGRFQEDLEKWVSRTNLGEHLLKAKMKVTYSQTLTLKPRRLPETWTLEDSSLLLGKRLC